MNHLPTPTAAAVFADACIVNEMGKASAQRPRQSTSISHSGCCFAFSSSAGEEATGFGWSVLESRSRATFAPRPDFLGDCSTNVES